MQKINSRKILTKKKPEKKFLLMLKKKAGRQNSGRITVRHRGGGVKRFYRIINFGQKKMNIPAKVIALEYDPNRTAYLMLLEYENGEKSYQIAPYEIKINDEIICAENAENKIGNRMKLKNIPVGTSVYNVEIQPGKGGQIIRSAGSSAQVMAQLNNFTHLKMASGEIRKISQECFASIGQVSHPEKRFEKIRKAGISRLRNKRPSVRGAAMSAYDHPHGGGKNKAPIGLKHPKTKWGKPALGGKTRKRKKWTNKYIIKKRKEK